MELAFTLLIVGLAFGAGWFAALVWWEFCGSTIAARRKWKRQQSGKCGLKDSHPLLSAVSPAERDSALSIERRRVAAMAQISELTQSAKKGMDGGHSFHAGTGVGAIG